MLLTEMTSPEIAALPRDIVVVYPVASCEQRQWPIMAAPTPPCVCAPATTARRRPTHRCRLLLLADSLHLPVFVDTMISNAVTAGVHEAIPDDCLVLPCQYL